MPRTRALAATLLLLSSLRPSPAAAAAPLRVENFLRLHAATTPGAQADPALEWPKVSWFVEVPPGQPGAGLHSGQAQGTAACALTTLDPALVVVGAARPGSPPTLLTGASFHRGQATATLPDPPARLEVGLYRNVVGTGSHGTDRRWNQMMVQVGATPQCPKEQILGWFQVQQASWGADGVLEALVVSFEQSCNGAVPVRGTLMAHARPPAS